MKMGRERNVLRWDIHASLLAERRARAEQALAAMPVPEDNGSHRQRDRAVQLRRDVRDLQLKQARLGPSPRAKMG